MKVKEVNNVSVITLKGNVLGGPDAQEVHQELHKLLEQKKNKVIVDLSDVKFMNSSGLGMMVAMLTTVRNAGGRLAIAGASNKIESLLVVTKLITVFEHYDNVKEAVSSLNK